MATTSKGNEGKSDHGGPIETAVVSVGIREDQLEVSNVKQQQDGATGQNAVHAAQNPVVRVGIREDQLEVFSEKQHRDGATSRDPVVQAAQNRSVSIGIREDQLEVSNKKPQQDGANRQDTVAMDKYRDIPSEKLINVPSDNIPPDFCKDAQNSSSRLDTSLSGHGIPVPQPLPLRSADGIPTRGPVFVGAFAGGLNQDHSDELQNSFNLDGSHPTITNANNQGLAVADLVDPEAFQETADLPQAEEWQSQEQNTSSFQAYKAVFSLLGVVILCVITLLVVFLGLDDGHNNDDPTSSSESPTTLGPTTMKPSSMSDKLLALLPEHSLEAIRDNSTAQFQAYQWMMDDPLLGDYSRGRLLQRFALVTFYFSTGGESWFQNTSWLSYSTHECYWFVKPDYSIGGSTDSNVWLPQPPSYPCRNMSNLVVDWQYEHLPLEVNNLVGEIPNELFLLTSLKSIHLSTNALQGSISTVVGKLRELEWFYTPNNQITGQIPSEIGLCSRLLGISVIYNQITGTVSSGLHTGPHHLEHLFIDNNLMTGTIPPEISRLSRLQDFFLLRNLLTGTLPVELMDLAGLFEFMIYDNPLSGTIPTEFGRLTNLVQIAFGHDSMNGTLPSEIGNIASLESLYFANAKLSGTIPTSIGQLSMMFAFRVNGNHITGDIPSEMGLIPWVGNSSNASLTQHAKDLGYPTGLISIADNLLSGTIPTELGKLSSVAWCILNNNNLTGTIPTEFEQATQLQLFFLHNNQLVGPLPTEIGRLDSIMQLQFQNNQLAGSLPSELGLMSQVSAFNVANNTLTGEIPEELGAWAVANTSVLTLFDISGNALSGTLPDEVCHLEDALFVFDCSDILCGCECSCGNDTDASIMNASSAALEGV